MTDLMEAKEQVRAEAGRDEMRRRDFLSLLTASFAALGMTGCEFHAPRETIVPHLKRPEDAAPGLARWFASTCGGCPAACGVLAKQRDGRPIKLEGNPDHPLSRGGLCARGQATVLDLYDSRRFKAPAANGEKRSWDEIDAEIARKLKAIDERGGAIRLLGPTATGPTADAAVEKFLAAWPTARRVVYDPVSASPILDAHALTHGKRALPAFRFDRAKVIVSFDADFLGTWISPVEFTKAYAAGRDLAGGRKTMSRHVQFEPRMSITGANADLRVPLRPSREMPVAAELARRIAELADDHKAMKILGPPGAGPIGAMAKAEGSNLPETLNRLASELWAARGETLIVSGSRNPDVQLIANYLNDALGNYGAALDLAAPSRQFAGSDADMDKLIDEMKAGEVEALIVWNANPVYEHPRGAEFAEALGGIELTVSLADRPDETTPHAKYLCPDHHALESWGDAEPRRGTFSLMQPTVAPLYDTRAAVESLAAWAGAPQSAYDRVRAAWREKIHPAQSEHESFTAFWNAALQRGAWTIENAPEETPAFDRASIGKINLELRKPADDELEFAAYPSHALYAGRQANNPWLQELPDPVTKTTWGNHASVSPATAHRLGLEERRVVELAAGGRAIRLPLHVQPGLSDGVVAAALGYGRANAGPIAANYPVEKMFPIEKAEPSGADVFPFLGAASVKLEPTDAVDPLAKSQTYDYQTEPHTGEVRHQVRETTLAEYIKDPRAGVGHEHHLPSIWAEHEYDGHHWAMAIDTNKCTGCSACVVGCQAENNIPVVGKAEVRNNRDMHWIRIDRYYSGSPEAPDPNPDVSMQPMLCQHCDNAPCETVCPVLASVHSSEGLNVQVYNRCVGTKYCANNCPYKVRRFNWFDYAHNDLTQNLALNPDVTVRSRGVMEKCSFCIQRINDGKRRANGEDRNVADGEIVPACAQSCPAEAILFGDINDKDSRVARAAEDPRGYRVLEELGVRPSVVYQTKVRNREAGPPKPRRRQEGTRA